MSRLSRLGRNRIVTERMENGGSSLRTTQRRCHSVQHVVFSQSVRLDPTFANSQTIWEQIINDRDNSFCGAADRACLCLEIAPYVF